MVDHARSCGIVRIGYHHLPPAGAPDAALVRVENEGFGEALLAQYLAARVNGIAVLAEAVHRIGRPVYLSELRGPEWRWRRASGRTSRGIARPGS